MKALIRAAAIPVALMALILALLWLVVSILPALVVLLILWAVVFDRPAPRDAGEYYNHWR